MADAYPILKAVHVGAALLTFAGFLLRGAWMLADSPLLDSRPARVAPHILDSLFLASGIALVVSLRLPVTAQPWLLAKFAGLVAYIVFGSIALRRGRRRRTRVVAFAISIVAFLYIVGAALSKSAASWLHAG